RSGKVQFLKVMVVVMGFLIIAGVITLATVITKRLAGHAEPGFTDRSVALPQGARVVSAIPAEGRLAVHLALPDGSARIEFFDLRSGRPAGTIALSPEVPK